MHIAPLLLACLVAACGSSRPASTTGTEPPATCLEACTRYAACHEKVHGREYRDLDLCVRDCESRDAPSQRDYLRHFGSDSGDCERMLGEDLAEPDGPTID